MAACKKHIRTSYADKRKEHRAAASRHVLVLEAQINENDKRRDFCLQHWNFVQKLSQKCPAAPCRRAWTSEKASNGCKIDMLKHLRYYLKQ